MENTEIKQEKNEAAVPAQPVPPAQKKPKTPIPKKKRKWVKRVIALAVLVAIVAALILWQGSAPKSAGNLGYIPATAATQDITVSVSGTGTVQPIDSYKVTALVKGEVLEAPFEEGDTIAKDDLLFRIDSKDVENSIDRSALSLQQAQLSYDEAVKNKGDSLKNVDIKANASGVVQEVYYKVGEIVAAGTPIADILDRDHMLLTVPFHSVDAAGVTIGQAASVVVDGTFETLSGTVDSIAVSDQTGVGGTLVREIKIKVSNPGALSDASTGTASIGGVDCAAGGAFSYAAQKTLSAKSSGELSALSIKEGDWVSDGQVVGAYKATDMDAQIENARLSLQSAELALQSTKDQLDSYTVTSPISGTIVELNYKVGDNVDPTTAAAAGAGYLAIIYDMSTLTFEMKIDELDINKVQVGQEVEITADALEGQSFTGRVDKININGTTVNGVTTYPVTVVIDDPKSLLPGMNVSAEIVVERASDVLTVPVEAVERGAEGGTVTVALPGALNAEGTAVVDPTKLEKRTVKLGRNDSANIEILEGLQAGDIVVFKNATSNVMAMMMGG